MKPGWRTSELTVLGLVGATIYDLASLPSPTLPDAVGRGLACLALAWLGGAYAKARTEAKRP